MRWGYDSAMTIRVGVFGAAGKVGQTVCAAVADEDDLVLAGAIDPFAAGQTVAGIEVVATPDDLSLDVMIDFTVLDAARANLAWAAANGVHAVVGPSRFEATHRIEWPAAKRSY